jgi:histidinol-phosphate aminotransferase
MDFKSLLQPHLNRVNLYTPGKPSEQLRREKNIKGEIIKIASNENPYPPIDEVKQAIIEELENINRYPNSGSYYLCEELAEHIGVERDQIFVGNGSNEIIDLLVRAFADRTDEIIYPHPSFIAYDLIVSQTDVRGITVPLRNKYYVDLQAMKERITQNTKMVIVCNPNNPTGTYVPGTDVELFMHGLRADILVVFDEAYFEYVQAGDFPDSTELMHEYPNIIILRTFSKVHALAGLRVGYSISHPDIVECLHKVRQPFNVNRIAQAGARAALKHIDKIRGHAKENSEQMRFVRDELLALGFDVPESQTNFLLVVPPEEHTGIVERLEDRGIIVRPAKRWGFGEASFRVTVGTEEENGRFLKDIKEIMRRK